ncbi:unnamed protein product, partial [Amoebophrya sp. A25]
VLSYDEQVLGAAYDADLPVRNISCLTLIPGSALAGASHGTGEGLRKGLENALNAYKPGGDTRGEETSSDEPKTSAHSTPSSLSSRTSSSISSLLVESYGGRLLRTSDGDERKQDAVNAKEDSKFSAGSSLTATTKAKKSSSRKVHDDDDGDADGESSVSSDGLAAAVESALDGRILVSTEGTCVVLSDGFDSSDATGDGAVTPTTTVAPSRRIDIPSTDFVSSSSSEAPPSKVEYRFTMSFTSATSIGEDAVRAEVERPALVNFLEKQVARWIEMSDTTMGSNTSVSSSNTSLLSLEQLSSSNTITSLLSLEQQDKSSGGTAKIPSTVVPSASTSLNNPRSTSSEDSTYDTSSGSNYDSTLSRGPLSYLEEVAKHVKVGIFTQKTEVNPKADPDYPMLRPPVLDAARLAFGGLLDLLEAEEEENTLGSSFSEVEDGDEGFVRGRSRGTLLEEGTSLSSSLSSTVGTSDKNRARPGVSSPQAARKPSTSRQHDVQEDG